MFRTKLSSGPSEGHVVVSLHGELDLVDAAAVAAALGALAARDLWIIVDLSGLEFIDAAGVAALSRGRRQARNAGGGLLLAAPQPRVQRVLSLIWEADSSGVQATMAAAAASAGSPPVRWALRSGGSPLGSAGRASP
jgi:anti-sigma B factor antagonist